MIDFKKSALRKIPQNSAQFPWFLWLTSMLAWYVPMQNPKQFDVF